MKALLKRELQALARRRADMLNPLGFLFLAVMLFAVAVPQDNVPSTVAVGLLWLIVLLTNLLSLDAMFHRDYESGVLE